MGVELEHLASNRQNFCLRRGAKGASIHSGARSRRVFVNDISLRIERELGQAIAVGILVYDIESEDATRLYFTLGLVVNYVSKYTLIP